MSVEVGRIQTASTRLAYCEVNEDLMEGDMVCFETEGAEVRGRIAYLQTGLTGKNIAHVEFLDAVPRVPKRFTPVFRGKDTSAGGMEFVLGKDAAKRPVSIRLNALFRHVLLAGMTQVGKTHLEFAVLEQVAAWNVPVFLVDAQAEFRGLSDSCPHAIVTREAEGVVALLRERRVVVLDVQEDSLEVRREKTAAVLVELFRTQEKASAAKTPYPPVLIMIDEADVFAPASHRVGEACTNALIEVAKRGSKLGLGLVLSTVRPGAVHLDVRSQLNGAFFFKLTDASSRHALRDFGMTRYDVELISRLGVGECVVAGSLVQSPLRMKVRRISSSRTRSVDFEGMLQADLRERGAA